jgi:hypothetical protein
MKPAAALFDQRLKYYSVLLRNRWPLIGGWLNSFAVKGLAHSDSREAVSLLAHAYTTGNAALRERILPTLLALHRADLIDEVCAVWFETQSKWLEALLRRQRWIAQSPPKLRLLSALLIGQPERCANDGPELLSPLFDACIHPDRSISGRACRLVKELANPITLEALPDVLCAAWAQTRHMTLEEMMKARRCVAKHPPEGARGSRRKGCQHSLIRAGD